MASGKTTRPRPQAGAVAASAMEHPVWAMQNGGKMEENVKSFKIDRFDPESYVQAKCSLNDKEIKHLCSYLLDLKKASAEETRRSFYANYTAFIQTYLIM